MSFHKRIYLIMFVFAILLLTSGVRFGGISTAYDEIILFESIVRSPGNGDISALFLGNMRERRFKAVTFFPEKIEYLQEAGVLQIQNHFGVYRTGIDWSGPESVSAAGGFEWGDTIPVGKIQPVHSSPSGRFIIVLQQTSPVYGTLQLFDLATEKSYTVDTGIEMNLDRGCGKWSPDSRFFVYEKSGSLFFLPVETLSDPDSPFQILKSFPLGTGGYTSFLWYGTGELLLLEGRNLYGIRTQDFYQRTFYTDIPFLDNLLGQIPDDFNPNTDRFWIGPDRNAILLQKGSSLSYLSLTAQERMLGNAYSFPLLQLGAGAKILEIEWSPDNRIFVLTGSWNSGPGGNSLYSFDARNAEGGRFIRENLNGVRHMGFSPDGSSHFILQDTTVSVYAEDDDPYFILENCQPLQGIWIDEQSLVIAGVLETILLDTQTGESRLLFMSQGGTDFGFNNSNRLQINMSDKSLLFDHNRILWEETELKAIPEPKTYTDSYRTYQETLTDNYYESVVMIRKSSPDDFGTNPFFPIPETNFETVPNEGSVSSARSVYIRSGYPSDRREVALVFNLLDSAEGLGEILEVLDAYDVRCTFFVNGDVIDRFPEAVRELSISGHEIASLFYTAMDLTSSRYRIDKDFIVRGLAATEDLYFEATGSELRRYWHSPYYIVNESILEATREMNYYYIGRDMDTLDWVGKSYAGGDDELFLGSGTLVERILTIKKPGFIIPLNVGRTIPRDDYVYKRLDLLLNALAVQGYGVVPVSVLMEHSQLLPVENAVRD